jgi:adenylosuccinate synthase
MNTAIFGGFFGDEAKGAITHALSNQYDWVVRYNGGANSGHTIYRNINNVLTKYVHNLVPSFDWTNPNLKAFIGQGMVIDLEQLYTELSNLPKNVVSRTYIDKDAFIVTQKHKDIDSINNEYIGSTKRGIGPAYSDKVARSSQRIESVMDSNIIFQLKNLGLNFTNVLELKESFKNTNLLFEGAQSILLDIDHGTYPFVSSSNTAIAGIHSSGFSFVPLHNVYGVVKCYATRVGNGPFPTEIFGDDAEELRQLGKEYGATTGRPRRVGWLDLPALKYARDKGGLNKLIITKLDILNGCKTIKICNEYNKCPICPSDFFTAIPQYIELPGWNDSHNVNEIQPFLKYIEEQVELPVEYITCGISPKDFIKL